MGAWGTGLYSNDIAEDIREDCRDVFSVKTPEEGLRILEEDYLKEIQEDDYDELADFWYAVADYQWNKGILTERAKKKALELLGRGAGLDLWIEEGNKSDIKKRKEVLEKLKEKLNSPQPPKKKIRDSGIHYAIKKGDIIAVRPNEKFTIEFDYKEKQEWINFPYFTAEYLIATFLTIGSYIITIIYFVKNAVNFTSFITMFIIEAFMDGFSDLLSWILEKVLSFIPGIGFLLG